MDKQPVNVSEVILMRLKFLEQMNEREHLFCVYPFTKTLPTRELAFHRSAWFYPVVKNAFHYRTFPPDDTLRPKSFFTLL